MKTEITANLGAKVDKNKSYTPQKKAAIKAKLPEFTESIGEATRGIFTESFTVRDWVGIGMVGAGVLMPGLKR